MHFPSLLSDLGHNNAKGYFVNILCRLGLSIQRHKKFYYLYLIKSKSPVWFHHLKMTDSHN